ncbi:MAG: amino acid ABC transporter permease [Actinomycetota bacterium]|nr:MAG: amino acid ABC transporter permease [Actinomycetota bacterium]
MGRELLSAKNSTVNSGRNPLTDTRQNSINLPERPTILGWARSSVGSKGRQAGGVIVFLAVLGALVLLFHFTRESAPPYHWEFGVVWSFLPTLLRGLLLTLEITVLSIVFGMFLGIFVAAARLSGNLLIRVPVTGYIEVMRGTPVLVQLIWIFYVLPILAGIKLSGLESAVVAFSLNLGAFYGEAFRAGIQSVPKEQVETAEVLGLTYSQRMHYVVLPQAARNVLPVLLSISVNLFKDTSLVSALGVSDLMFLGESVATNVFRPLEILTTVAVIYFLVAFPITILVRRLELHLNRHRRK